MSSSQRYNNSERSCLMKGLLSENCSKQNIWVRMPCFPLLKKQVSVGRPSCGYLRSMGYHPCCGRRQEKIISNHRVRKMSIFLLFLLLLCLICICITNLILLKWRCRQSSTVLKCLSTMTIRIATCGWLLGAIVRTSLVLKTSGGTRSMWQACIWRGWRRELWVRMGGSPQEIWPQRWRNQVKRLRRSSLFSRRYQKRVEGHEW